jgi:AcrR family transcriptional regulator
MERSIPKHKIGQSGMADLRVRRSRDGLRTALLQLLERRAFEDITVREIVDLAGVGYTTFFRHFTSKDALLDAVILVEIEQLTNRSLPIYEAADPSGACLALCAYVDEHRSLWSALLIGGAAPKVREEMLRRSRQITTTRTSNQPEPVELGIALAVAIILELLSWWLRQPAPWPANHVAQILHDRIIVPSSTRSRETGLGSRDKSEV